MAASAVLSSVRAEHSTVVDAEAGSMSGSLVTVTLAVLSYSPQLTKLVPLVTCTVSLAPPESRSTASQCSVWAGGVPMIEQFAGAAGSSCQSTPSPAGSRSSITTPVAWPSPLFVAVTVKPMSEPASTGTSESATLVSTTSGQSTVVVALFSIGAAFVASRNATFGYALQLAKTVGLVTCTTRLAPGAKLATWHVNTPFVIEHAPAGDWDSIVQLIPVPVGNTSLSSTPVAVPVPGASLLLPVSVNPMSVPALTVASWATLTKLSAGHCTVVVAESPSTFGSLTTVTPAVLAYGPQLSSVVWLITCT